MDIVRVAKLTHGSALEAQNLCIPQQHSQLQSKGPANSLGGGRKSRSSARSFQFGVGAMIRMIFPRLSQDLRHIFWLMLGACSTTAESGS